MRKAFPYSFFFLVPLFFLASCYKDLGNYSYHEVNKIDFLDFDTARGYTALYGHELAISPRLVMSLDKDPAEDGYTYEWSLRLGIHQNPNSPLRDSVLSDKKDLRVIVDLAPGTYTLQYRVTDKSSGVEHHIRTKLLVSTEVYEGYFVLSDAGGKSRLDMLSYSSANASFTQYTDVLQKMSSPVPMEGEPRQVLSMFYSRANVNPLNYGIFLLTSGSTNRIHQETFAWDPTYNIRYLMLGEVPQNFTAKKLTGAYQNTNSSPVLYMYGSDNNMYNYSTTNGWAFKYQPMNVYTVDGTPFRVSPYVVTDGAAVLTYNMDKRCFVTAPNSASLVLADVPEALNYPKGYELVWMDMYYYPEAGQTRTVYAVLKDPVTSKYYLLRFNLGTALDTVNNTNSSYFREITAPDFAQASCYAASADMGYLFYSVDGKLYEYDLFLQTTKQMLDKGSAKINFLDFLHFYDRYGKPNYVAWSKSLTVGYYDPAGTPGSNGVLEQYTVPPVNGQIEQTYRWTGFGKIASVAYRTR